jgi:hypothetical protein
MQPDPARDAPRRRSGPDDGVIHDAPTPARERVSHDRDAAGLPHQTHRPHRIGRVVGGVIGGSVVQVVGERQITGSNDPLCHQRICDVRAADCCSGIDLLKNVVPAQVKICRQQLDDMLRPPSSALPGPVQFLEQAGRRRVLQVTEQVDADALMLARDLDPAHEGDSVMCCGGGGRLPARGRVVIGQREHIQTSFGGAGHDFGRWPSAVTGRGVRVQVDEHGPRLGHRHGSQPLAGGSTKVGRPGNSPPRVCR